MSGLIGPFYLREEVQNGRGYDNKIGNKNVGEFGKCSLLPNVAAPLLRPLKN